MKSTDKFPTQFVFILFSLLVFFLPVYKKPVPLIIALLFVSLLYFSVRTKSLRSFRLTPASAGSLILYALYAVGLLYTSDMKSGLFDLEVKMSFLAFPLIFALSLPFQKENFIEKLTKIFVAGVIFSTLFSLSCSTYRFFNESWSPGEFLYIRFSRQFHPSYYAMYINLAIIIVAGFIISEWRNLSPLRKLLLIFLFLYFVVIVFLVNSKAGILITLISLFLLLLVKLFLEKKIKTGVVAILSLTAISLLVWTFMPGIKTRFQLAYHSLFATEVQSPNPEEGSAQRLVIWKCGLQAVKENPLWGTGTGDVHETLESVYKKNTFWYGIKYHRNAHNQFLQTTIAIGIPGLLCLLYIFSALVVIGLRKRQPVILMLVLILFLNFLVESMLETQAGTVFTAFFVSFFAMKETNVGNEVSVSKD